MLTRRLIDIEDSPNGEDLIVTIQPEVSVETLIQAIGALIDILRERSTGGDETA